jgi:hypothetical protein
MTRILAIVALGCLATVVMSTPAKAQRNMPYCAQFTDGGMDCSYPSLQSCLATVSGVGGACTVNPRSPNQPPPPPGFFQRLMQGNGPAFAPVDVGPPPDSGQASTRRQPRREWPYCAWYSNGSTNCGFPTLQSCRAAVSGVGGVCRANPRAAPTGGRS